jgi:hypothetical protein
MALKLTCPCGQKLVVSESAGGQKVPCPQCKRLVVVPVLAHLVRAAATAPTPAHGTAPAEPMAAPPLLLDPAPPPLPSSIQPPPPLPPTVVPVDAPNYVAPGPPARSGAQEYFQQGAPPQCPVGDEEIITVFEATCRPVVADVQEFHEKDRPQRKKKDRKKERMRQEKRQLKVVSVGLAMIYWGIICLLLSIVLNALSNILAFTLVGAAVAGPGDRFGSGGPGGGSMTGGLLIVIGAQVLAYLLQAAFSALCFVGAILCCWVPSRARARGFMITSLCLEAGSVILGIAALVMVIGSFVASNRAVADAGLQLGLGLTAAALVIFVTAFVLFFFFLRNFAEYLDDGGTAWEAMQIMRNWIYLTIVGVLLIGGGPFLVTYLFCFGAVIILGGFIFWFIFYVKQWMRLLNLIAALRQTLRAEYSV